MPPEFHSRFALRLLVCLPAAILLAWLGGATLVRGLLPVWRAELRWMKPQMEIESLSIRRGDLVLSARLPVAYATGPRQRRFGLNVETGTSLAPALIAPVLFFSLWAAWPAAWRRKLRALGLALPLLLLAAMADMPFPLLWGAQTAWAEQIGAVHVVNTPDNIAKLDGLFSGRGAVSFWRTFLSGGGRQFMALLVFLAVLPLMKPNPASDRPTVGNAP